MGLFSNKKEQEIRQLKLLNNKKDQEIRQLKLLNSNKDQEIKRLKNQYAEKDTCFNEVMSDALRCGSKLASKHMKARKDYLNRK